MIVGFTNEQQEPPSETLEVMLGMCGRAKDVKLGPILVSFM